MRNCGHAGLIHRSIPTTEVNAADHGPNHADHPGGEEKDATAAIRPDPMPIPVKETKSEIANKDDQAQDHRPNSLGMQPGDGGSQNREADAHADKTEPEQITDEHEASG